jgi:enamine deaminase RidA (YjgF/YER057c/UK114 family)
MFRLFRPLRQKSSIPRPTPPGGAALIALLLALGTAPVAQHLSAQQAAGASVGETFDPEARLAELGITLPTPPQPVANYVNGVQTGDLVFLAGKGPKRADGSEIRGKLGADISIEEGYEAARLTAINQLAVLKVMLGDLSRVRRVVKVLGMVNSEPDFVEQPAVINGFSDLIVEVFGDRGRHARAAVGMASLPRGQAVEIEMIVEVDPG